MDWISFIGAFVGGVLGIFAVGISLEFWDQLKLRKQKQTESDKTSVLTPDDILESHLEQYIVQNFATLFPGWTIFSDSEGKQSGVRYRTEAGEIDILSTDSGDGLVVIELKRNKAPDTVVAQTDRYIAYVERKLARPNQQVRGLIIAKTLDKHLAYILSQRQKIDLWAYGWSLQFDKDIVRRKFTESSTDNVSPGEQAVTSVEKIINKVRK